MERSVQPKVSGAVAMVTALPEGIWRAAVKIAGREICLGYFGSPEDAKAVLATFGNQPVTMSRQA